MEKELSVNILYVDDETNNLESFKANYRRHYTIFTAVSANQAKRILVENDIHIIITDQKMPGTTGTQLLEHAVEEYPLQTRIILSAYLDKEAVMEAINRGLIFKYLLKPYDTNALKTIIDEAYEVYYLKRIKEELYMEWLKTKEDLEKLLAGAH